MKCTRCSAEIPAQSRFCLRCGTAVATQTTQMPTGYTPATPSAPFVQNNSGNKKLFATIGVLALVVIALGAFVAKGLVQKAGDNSKGQLVQAPGNGGSGALVQAPGDSKAASIVQAPGDSKPSPIVQEGVPYPADIIDYLKYLRAIEMEKRTILTNFGIEAKSMMATSNINIIGAMAGSEGDSGIDNAMDTYRKQSENAKLKAQQVSQSFEQLINKLEAYPKPVPPACIGLRDIYYKHLSRASTLSTDVMGLFASAPNPANGDERQNAASAVFAKAQGIIASNTEQKEMMDTANKELDEVRRQFHIANEWQVEDPQGGAGGLFGKMSGMLGL